MQSALESVKGVEEVSVSLSKNEAVVNYEAGKVKVEDLIKAVKEAYGMNLYEAKVKKEWIEPARRRPRPNERAAWAFERSVVAPERTGG